MTRRTSFKDILSDLFVNHSGQSDLQNAKREADSNDNNNDIVVMDTKGHQVRQTDARQFGRARPK